MASSFPILPKRFYLRVTTWIISTLFGFFKRRFLLYIVLC